MNKILYSEDSARPEMLSAFVCYLFVDRLQCRPVVSRLLVSGTDVQSPDFETNLTFR